MEATAAVKTRLVEPSLANALPYFLPLTVFPLVVVAVLEGGWWIAGPFVFQALASRFDSVFGVEERSMDPDRTVEGQLFLYKLSAWTWALLWPATLVFSLWQILVVGHLAAWEALLVALALTTVGQSIFIVGHELIHRRSLWERRVAEVLLSSASFPTYATEHVYIHHPLVCTPGDPGSPTRGQTLWKYLPREVKANIVGSWLFERDRLARRQLPAWHYTNAFWRYLILFAFWYGLVYWMGGLWAVLVYATLCFGTIFSMKVSNYVQHYGLRRIRLPNGRYETVKPRHAWSADHKFTNWLYYNMQRHADHHTASNRRYPLLQHYGENDSPQLPGTYAEMAGLAVFPKRWFQVMDPLLDRQRAMFYPEIDDWSAYDSPAFADRPEAFEAIAEIHAAAPRFAAWINRSPELLDGLKRKEFMDLDLPDGFGPDPEFEKVARRGLARLYWTRELGVAEMMEQLSDSPVQDAGEAVDAARQWSNDKVFQIGMHTMRGNLAPTEAGTALSHAAEATIAFVLTAACEDFAERSTPERGSSIAAVALGDLGSGEAAPGVDLDLLFLYEGGPGEHFEALCRRFHKALRALSRHSLLFAPIPRGWKPHTLRSLAEFADYHRTVGPAGELRELARGRCVFVSGDPEIRTRFEAVRGEALAGSPARNTQLTALSQSAATTAEPGLTSFETVPGGLRDVERAARFLQLTHADSVPDVLAEGAAPIFTAAGAKGLIPGPAAERLSAAYQLWRNLRGILRLVADDAFVEEAASPQVKGVIAAACGCEDFTMLGGHIRETAAHAAADIAAIEGMAPPGSLPLAAPQDPATTGPSRAQ